MYATLLTIAGDDWIAAPVVPVPAFFSVPTFETLIWVSLMLRPPRAGPKRNIGQSQAASITLAITTKNTACDGRACLIHQSLPGPHSRVQALAWTKCVREGNRIECCA